VSNDLKRLLGWDLTTLASDWDKRFRGYKTVKAFTQYLEYLGLQNSNCEKKASDSSTLHREARIARLEVQH